MAAKKRLVDINVHKTVLVDFNDVVDNDLEWLDDKLSELVTDDPCPLQNIGWKVVGSRYPYQVELLVTGYIHLPDEDLDPDDEEDMEEVSKILAAIGEGNYTLEYEDA